MNAAVRSGVVLYAIDARGLLALPPGGDASTASPSGVGILTGAVQLSTSKNLADSQETLYTIAADTGGRAIMDSNDLALGIRLAQQDLTNYYVIGYRSTSSAEDHTYRRIRLRLANNPKARLDYRSGFYPTSSLRSPTPMAVGSFHDASALVAHRDDWPVAVGVHYFRLSQDTYFASLALTIPCAALWQRNRTDTQAVTLRIAGEVRDEAGTLASSFHDTIRIDLLRTGVDLASQRVQYNTGVVLPSGTYSLAFLVRDDESRTIGEGEEWFIVPEPPKAGLLSLSSIVLSSQKPPCSSALGRAESDSNSPPYHLRIQELRTLVPDKTRIFRRDQTVYVYCEVYEPTINSGTNKASLRAQLSILSADHVVYRVEAVRTTQHESAGPGVIALHFEVPMSKVEAGVYTSQMTIIDELGSTFAIRRTSIRVLP